MSASAEHDHDSEPGYVCKHVLRSERPLLVIWHDPDGSWEFACGVGDHDAVGDVSVCCARCAFTRNRVTLDLSDIPAGYFAERPAPEARWVVRPFSEDEQDAG